MFIVFIYTFLIKDAPTSDAAINSRIKWPFCKKYSPIAESNIKGKEFNLPEHKKNIFISESKCIHFY